MHRSAVHDRECGVVKQADPGRSTENLGKQKEVREDFLVYRIEVWFAYE